MTGSVASSTETSSSASTSAQNSGGHPADSETTVTPTTAASGSAPTKTPSLRQQQAHKLSDFLKANLENLEGLSSANKVCTTLIVKFFRVIIMSFSG